MVDHDLLVAFGWWMREEPGVQIAPAHTPVKMAKRFLASRQPPGETLVELAARLNGPECGAPDASSVPVACRGCGVPLRPENLRCADGCPCNSPRGINHGLVPKNVCTCDKCDPEETGSVRTLPKPTAPEPTLSMLPSRDSPFISALPTAEAYQPTYLIAATMPTAPEPERFWRVVESPVGSVPGHGWGMMTCYANGECATEGTICLRSTEAAARADGAASGMTEWPGGVK